LYVNQKMSIPQISDKTGICRSTVRYSIKKAGVLRSPREGILCAAAEGRLGTGMKGKKRVITDNWKKNISLGKLKSAELNAKGISKKPNGYLEYTRGEHKGRSVHVVTMEGIIGRRLSANECVHHIDHNRQNNAPDNLVLMTRTEHARLNAIENLNNRKRDEHGKFE